MKNLNEVLQEVIEERRRQHRKFGEQNLDPFKYLSILGEEVGEANQAANDAFDWAKHTGFKDLAHFREELIQVAAVAVAMVECLDRNKWSTVVQQPSTPDHIE